MDDGHDGTASDAEPVAEDVFAQLFRSGTTNAILAWAMLGMLALVLAESVADFDFPWIVFVGVVGALASLPAIASRNWRIMLPWELLVLALLPILVRGLFGGEVGAVATYLSLAALALIAVVELHTFTALEVTHWFAVALVVLTSMAAVAAWSVIRWNFDQYLGTSYLTTNEALMVEFAWVTAVGFVAGLLFDAYFRRRESVLQRAVALVVRR